MLHLQSSFQYYGNDNLYEGVNRSLEGGYYRQGKLFQIYSKIMIPLTLPAISTISIFFMGAWNNILFRFSLSMIKTTPYFTRTLNFNGEEDLNTVL